MKHKEYALTKEKAVAFLLIAAILFAVVSQLKLLLFANFMVGAVVGGFLTYFIMRKQRSDTPNDRL